MNECYEAAHVCGRLLLYAVAISGHMATFAAPAQFFFFTSDGTLQEPCVCKATSLFEYLYVELLIREHAADSFMYKSA
ncbi:hypothetical protein LY76DRAFT_85301 [Colletotrichum caudatum]|nr:hypothetical protein LY76DRAFT_85301 [Colletotrichum caudatum]